MSARGQKGESAAGVFRRTFGTDPEAVAHAPGRVNLIGDHTDYEEGFAMPMALDQTTAAAFRARDDGIVRCVAADFGGESARIDSAAPSGRPAGWRKYVAGAVWELRKFAGRDLRGADLAIKSSLPIGAGLSSSAALELATLRALCQANRISWQPARMAALAQTAENVHAGVACGIMDQMTVACGREGHAIFLDCRSLRRRFVPLPPEWAVVVADSGTRRSLRSSAYNRRRAECARAAEILGVRVLRDASMRMLDKAAPGMDKALHRRALHVIGENARTRAAMRAFFCGDATAAGALFGESHRSLRDNFEAGGSGLEAAVSAAVAHPACIGARQTGAGFAGCAVALVHADGAADFVAATSRRCRRAGLGASFYVSRGGGRARIEAA